MATFKRKIMMVRNGLIWEVIKEINAEEITVLTKFLKNPNEPSDKEELSLYVMSN